MSKNLQQMADMSQKIMHDALDNSTREMDVWCRSGALDTDEFMVSLSMAYVGVIFGILGAWSDHNPDAAAEAAQAAIEKINEFLQEQKNEG